MKDETAEILASVLSRSVDEIVMELHCPSRDRLAMAAMQALLSSSNLTNSRLVFEAYKIADAMLDERCESTEATRPSGADRESSRTRGSRGTSDRRVSLLAEQ